jgi:tol-pal system protein YbgF
MRVLALAVLTCLSLALPVQAQDRAETLADIRQELSVLYVEIQKLKRELSTTGGASGLPAGGSILERVEAIEGELQRLTARTEELQYRIDRIVQDASNRIGDLEFRLCELEEACDIATLGEGTTLGGTEPQTGTAGAESGSGDAPADAAGDPQMAVGEQADFDRARQALEAGNHAEAARLFQEFRQTYPGGPLSGKAGLLRGEALEAAGQTAKAARAYLDTFSGAPEGPQAPEALFRLGRALGTLGQTEEACVMLAEVANRYPGADVVTKAQDERQTLGCQ